MVRQALEGKENSQLGAALGLDNMQGLLEALQLQSADLRSDSGDGSGSANCDAEVSKVSALEFAINNVMLTICMMQRYSEDRK